MEEIIKTSGLVVYHAKEPGEKGKTRVENLEELVSATTNFEQSIREDKTNKEIAEQYLDMISLDSGDRQASEHDDAAQLMTLHSAKGLESEAVILAQSYRNNSNLDKIFPIFSQDFSCKDLIYNPKIFRNNIFIDSNFKSFEIKNLSENRNLLYVACTRAKSIFIVNGYRTKDSWFSNSLFSQ